MIIKEKIIEMEIATATDRLNKLNAMEAPAIITKALEQTLTELKSGIIKISGDADLLNLEFEKWESRKGNGGKVYLQINENINYFPNAKYGKFITKAN